MNAWTSIFTAAGVNDCLIDLSCRSWKNPGWQPAAIWSAIVSWLSICMPRFLTAVDNCSTVPFRNVDICGRVLLSSCRVPSQIIFVLSSLSFRRLLATQSQTRSKQLAKRSIASWHEAAGTLIYSCVSSAYTWLAKPNSDTMSNSSESYSKNSSSYMYMFISSYSMSFVLLCITCAY